MLKFIKNNYWNIFIIFSYVVITLVMTIPVIFNINSAIPSIPTDNDAFAVMGVVQNMEVEVLGGDATAVDKILYFLNPLNYFYLYYYYFILYLLLGNPLAYNIIWLLSFVLAGITSYLLIKYLIKNRYAAFLGGIIYSFSYYHIHHAQWGHFGATHIEFIPLFILFLLKFIKNPNWKNLTLTCISFIFLARGEHHYAAFIVLFVIVLLIYIFITNKKLLINKKLIKYGLIVLIAGLAALAFFYYPLFEIAFSETNYIRPPINQVIKHSSDAIGIITPNNKNPFWGELFYGISSSFTDLSPFIGFTALFFAVLALIYVRKKAFFWGIIAFLFYIFSLGPFLHFMGVIRPYIPMPYILIYEYFPWFDNIRTIERMNVLSILAIAILFGFGFKYFIKRFKSINNIRAFSGVIGLMIILEFFVAPITIKEAKIPDYYHKVKEDKNINKILQIPGSTNYAFASMSRYYKSFHQKEIIDGLDPARKVPGKWDFQYKTPVVDSLLYSLPQHGRVQRDIIKHPFNEISQSVLNYYGIDSIIIDKEFIGDNWDMISPRSYIKIRNFINENIQVDNLISKTERDIFEISESDNYTPFMAIDQNWHPPDYKGRRIYRWAKNNASLKIINPDINDRSININFNVRTHGSIEEEFRYLEVIFNENSKGKYLVGPYRNIINVKIDDIRPGENTLKFRILDQFKHEVEDQEDKKNTVIFDEISYDFLEENRGYIKKIIQENKTQYNILILPKIQGSYEEELKKYKIAAINQLDFEKETYETFYGIDKNSFEKDNPIYKNMLYPDHYGHKTIKAAHSIFDPENFYKSINAALDAKKIKYIIMDKEYIEENFINAYIDYFKDNKSIKVIDNNNDYALLKFENINNDRIIYYMDGSWGSREKLSSKNEFYAQEILPGSKIKIINNSEEGKEVDFKFNLRRCDDNKNYKIKLIKNSLSEEIIDYKNNQLQSIKIYLKQGENIIEFREKDYSNDGMDSIFNQNAKTCLGKITKAGIY